MLKEKRRKRREAKEAEAKAGHEDTLKLVKSQRQGSLSSVSMLQAKAETAKKRAKDGFGEGDGDWMDSDPDRTGTCQFLARDG